MLNFVNFPSEDVNIVLMKQLSTFLFQIKAEMYHNPK